MGGPNAPKLIVFYGREEAKVDGSIFRYKFCGILTRYLPGAFYREEGVV